MWGSPRPPMREQAAPYLGENLSRAVCADAGAHPLLPLSVASLSARRHQSRSSGGARSIALSAFAYRCVVSRFARSAIQYNATCEKAAMLAGFTIDGVLAFPGRVIAAPARSRCRLRSGRCGSARWPSGIPINFVGCDEASPAILLHTEQACGDAAVTVGARDAEQGEGLWQPVAWFAMDHATVL